MAALLAWNQDLRRGVEADCGVCQRPGYEAKREEWGCDNPLEEPWDHIECFQCEPRNAEHCTTCGGSRQIAIDRCPWSHVGPRERFVLDAVLLLEAGVAPFPGTLGDWPASFVSAVNLVANERSKHLAEMLED